MIGAGQLRSRSCHLRHKTDCSREKSSSCMSALNSGRIVYLHERVVQLDLTRALGVEGDEAFKAYGRLIDSARGRICVCHFK